MNKTTTQKIYTSYCDENGNKIYLGDIAEFKDISGAVWQSRIVMEDGYPTVQTFGKYPILVKNPTVWEEKHDWTKSRHWSVGVGYGEYGSWNCNRTPLVDIAGYFKTSEDYKKATDKFNKKYGKYANSEQLSRPLPIRIVGHDKLSAYDLRLLTKG